MDIREDILDNLSSEEIEEGHRPLFKKFIKEFYRSANSKDFRDFDNKDLLYFAVTSFKNLQVREKDFFKVSSYNSSKNVTIFNIANDVFYSWKFIRKNINNYDLLHTFGNSYGLSFLTLYFGIKKKPIIREICNIISTPFYPIQLSSIINKIYMKNKNKYVYNYFIKS